LFSGNSYIPNHFFGSAFSFGLIAVFNPKWAWKHSYRTNSNRVSDPNEGDLLMTKVMGIVLIIVMIVILAVVIIKLYG
jgi:hypothetical protein